MYRKIYSHANSIRVLMMMKVVFCEKQFLYCLQPTIPRSKRFDIFPPDWRMLRRSRCVWIFLLNSTHLPFTSRLCVALYCCLSALRLPYTIAFQVNTCVSYFLDCVKISSIIIMMVVLSVFSSRYVPLPPQAILYIIHPAVSKVRRSVKYLHASNRWHGKKSLKTCRNTKMYHYYSVIITNTVS